MEALPGNSVLVGLTFVGPDPALLERRQFLGHVVANGETPGVCVRSPQNELVALPADGKAVLPAPRGQYHCLISGETITDPDLVTSWRITRANGSDARWEPNYAPHVRSIVPDEWEFTYRHDPGYLRRLVDSHAGHYLGQRVLVSIHLYAEHDDGSRFLGEEQRFGRIARASYGEGVIVALDTGKEYRLPPDLGLIQPAPPGDYLDTHTGQPLPRPDLITRWTILRGPEDDDA